MKKPVIEFKDFSFQYRAQAKPTLNNINLTIYKGEKVLIVGPSGSGKSTLSNCINGLVPFSYKGEIVLDPFGGSMTSVIAAKQNGRIGVGIELNKDMFDKIIYKNITEKLDFLNKLRISELEI